MLIIAFTVCGVCLFKRKKCRKGEQKNSNMTTFAGKTTKFNTGIMIIKIFPGARFVFFIISYQRKKRDFLLSQWI